MRPPLFSRSIFKLIDPLKHDGNPADAAADAGVPMQDEDCRTVGKKELLAFPAGEHGIGGGVTYFRAAALLSDAFEAKLSFVGAPGFFPSRICLDSGIDD